MHHIARTNCWFPSKVSALFSLLSFPNILASLMYFFLPRLSTLVFEGANRSVLSRSMCDTLVLLFWGSGQNVMLVWLNTLINEELWLDIAEGHTNTKIFGHSSRNQLLCEVSRSQRTPRAVHPGTSGFEAQTHINWIIFECCHTLYLTFLFAFKFKVGAIHLHGLQNILNLNLFHNNWSCRVYVFLFEFLNLSFQF